MNDTNPSIESVIVRLKCDSTVSYASFQNSIPLLHEILVENIGQCSLRDVEVAIVSEPAFIEPIHLRFEILKVGENRRIAPINVKLRHQYLADLTEAEKGLLIVEIHAGGKLLLTVKEPVEVLAYDQWGGTRGIPELLAAFCQPNHPVVDRIIGEAAQILNKSASGKHIQGYQTKKRDDVWAQVSAIYSAISSHDIQYSVPPASFASSGQKIRTPDRIISGGVATCLDLTMLLVSCFEQAGLNPVIFLKEGHAWAGCWLLNTTFPSSLTEDPQAVRKRIETGELIAFETTGLCQRPISSLRIASEIGLKHLRDEADDFRIAIDIRRARIERIQPLPSKGTGEQPERVVAEPQSGVEPPPNLPPLSEETILLDEGDKIDTPEGRLSRWKAKLLDLTRRNRLLNFKPSSVMVPLIVPEPAELEGALSDGLEWKFRAVPQIMDGSDPRQRDLSMIRTGIDPIEAMARDAMRDHELLAMVDKKKLDSQLYDIYLTVRTNLEEGGANTLYLAIGFLCWTEDDRAERTNLAPILLVPVTLNRVSVRAGFSIVRHDDEAIVSPTLLQMLRENHGIDLKNLDPSPSSEKGFDVEKIFARFREAVKEIPHWEVKMDVFLGVFSFTKYLMWKDLKDRSEDLKKNKVICHLIEHPQELLSAKNDIRISHDLDERHSPGGLLTPLLADSSQLNAVSRADEGHDFVLEGPPGTGKSQTITNLIAHFLGQGKRVLFVSEKMAALAVVENRLKSIGLGPFCLQLHSSKARKTEILEQLRNSFDAAQSTSVSDWELEVERLSRLRTDLNALVKALHFQHKNGLTVRVALDTAIAHHNWPAVSIDLPSHNTLDHCGLNEMLELSSSIQAVLGELGEVASHPLSSIRHQEWSYAWEEKFLNNCSMLDSAINALSDAIEPLVGPLELPLKMASLKLLSDFDELAGVLMSACEMPKGFVLSAENEDSRRQLERVRIHGQKRNEVWSLLSGSFNPMIAKLSGSDLQAQWIRSSSQWKLPRLLSQWKMAGLFRAYSLDGRRPRIEDIHDIIEKLIALNLEDEALRVADNDARQLLNEHFQGIETDWAAVKSFETWGARLSTALSRFQSAENSLSRNHLVERIHFIQRKGLLRRDGELIPLLGVYREKYLEFFKAFESLQGQIDNSPLPAGDVRASGALIALQSNVFNWKKNHSFLRQWCKWQGLRSKALNQGLAKVIAEIEGGSVPIQSVAEFTKYTYHVWWLKSVIDQEPALRTFSSSDHERKIREFRESDERFQKLTEKYIYAKLSAHSSSLSQQKQSGNEIAVLKHELAKQRAHFPVRKLIQHIPNLLPQLKPCLLMSPLSVAQYLDAGHAAFDVVVFDEASQIPVWDAIGVIARGKQLIVVGDPKQLPPTTFFECGSGDNIENVHDQIENVPVNDHESILDECMGIGMSQLSLDWHYRSQHESLISFSNARYYNSRLITFPSPVTKDVAVRLTRVSGTYDRGGARTNTVEAQAIVSRIVEHFGQEDPKAQRTTVGVVTFNQPQRLLIDQLLQAECLKKPELEERIAAHGDEKLFIKNLENVQGDERDIILFSITYGRDQAGRMAMNFGPINQEGGHRRLNVAVTRARRGIEIFSSIGHDDIDLSKTRAQGVIDLKAYLDYAQRGARAIAEESLPTGGEPDSPFEHEVIKALREAGWEIHPQVGCSGYRIDIGVVDKTHPGRYLAGIECDGASYHGSQVARDRDRLRQHILEGLGWTLFRVWSTDWWENHERTKTRLFNQLSDAANKKSL